MTLTPPLTAPHTVEFKLYPTDAQAQALNLWLRTCCWTYNRALEQRIKAYKRRKESASFYSQSAMLTEWRSRIESLRFCPLEFLRDSLRRVDRGFKAFFRRVKAGEKPGFPRFRSHHRFNSLECLAPGKYVRGGCLCFVPKLGLVRFRAGKQRIPTTQKLLRIVRRASGWYGQVLVDDTPKPAPPPTETSVGIDVGLNTFAALSNGEKIENPRWLRRSTRKLRAVQRRVSRRQKGSRNRRKAVKRLARVHERVAAQRKDFCHQQSRKIVNSFGLIAVEDLNVKGMARTRFAKSILDAAWSMFTTQLAYKAESAGRVLVKVNPRGTSQTCPSCGVIRAKALSERVHACQCGATIDRDVAAAQVIIARALGSSRGVTPVEVEALALDTFQRETLAEETGRFICK